MSLKLWNAPLLFAILALGSPLGAQVPVRTPPDTAAARDTTAVADSAKVAADTTPPPRFSSLFAAQPRGTAATVFSWDSDALQREGAVNLGDLLEQVPGMTRIRTGDYPQPEAVSAFGQTRGRIEIVVDGFVLDPLAAATLDISSIELAQITELRVERRIDVTRIFITTAEPLQRLPYSRIEAATGEPNGNLFRGIFTAPKVFIGPLALAIDRVDSDGRDGREPGDLFGVWAKSSLINKAASRGLQLELRQSRLRRQSGVPWAGDARRSDIVLRGRNRFSEAVTAELFAGRSKLAQAPPDSAEADSLATLERAVWQYGARAALRSSIAWGDVELRFRDASALPSRELAVSGGLDVDQLLHVAGNLTQASWKQGKSAVAWNARAEAGPIAGFTAFAELADGDRGAPLYADSLGHSTLEGHVIEGRSGSRLGLAARLLGIQATAALISLDADSAAPFGLPFDSAFGRSLNESASGIEVFGRLPLWPRAFTFTGSFNYWSKAGGWLYQPSRSWRLGLEVHSLPLASGNLEIFGRLEHERREAMLERNPAGPPSPDPEDVQAAFITMPIRNLLNGYLQIRVIDVRAFIQYYDLLGDGREDLAGRVLRGPRLMYGVKWQLFN